MTKRTTDYRLHTSIGYRLSRLSKLVQSRVEDRLLALGISRMQWCVLASIGLEGIETPSDLADYIGTTRQATSRLLVQMRKSKLVVQAFDENDGRSRKLRLSDAGEKLLYKCLPIIEENQMHFFGKLGKTSFTNFEKTVQALLEDETAHFDKF